MRLDDAIRTLRAGGPLPELAEAIGIVIESPQSSGLDLLLGLKYGGFVAEQAALALYKRNGRDLPSDHQQIVTDIQQWAEWVTAGQADENESAGDAMWLFAENGLARLADFLARKGCRSREERLFLVLYYFEEVDFREIAKILKLSESHVRAMHSRILSRLRDEFGRHVQPLSQIIRDLVA